MSANQTLNVSQEHLNIALNQLKLGFWEMDVETLQLACTPQCRLNIGADPEKGLSFEELLLCIVPEDRSRVEEDIKSALHSTDGIYQSQYRVRHPNGSLHWIEGNGTVLQHNNIPYRMVGTTLDITEKKDLELLKDELLSVATHELKTPVSAVKGYLQILHRFVESTGEPKFIQISKRALGSTERITRVLTDIADPIHRHLNQLKLVKENFDLRTLTDEIAANAMLINPDYIIEVNCKEQAFIVFADRYRIGQVLTNLMNNAVKYSPQNKKITVRLVQENGKMRVSVTDQGIGLKSEEHQKVFEKFYRAESAPKNVAGFGIGLFLSSEIIMRHHGQIGVEQTSEQQGSCFYFTLPINPDADQYLN